MDKSSKTVAELIGNRPDVFRVAPDADVLSALELLAEKDIGALIVSEGEQLIGIVSERDCARKVERFGRTARDTKVMDIMTVDVISVSPAHTVNQCVALMKRNRVRHLPVLQGNRIITMLSSRDILEEMIVEEEHLIHNLETERLRMTTDTGTY